MLPVDDNRSNGTGKRGYFLINVVREEKGEVFIMVSKEEKYIFKPKSKVVEDMINEEIKENNMEIAMRMLKDGKVSMEEIAKYLNLNKEEMKRLLVNMDNASYDNFAKIIKVDQAIYKAEKEVENGAEAVDAFFVFEDLERKYF